MLKTALVALLLSAGTALATPTAAPAAMLADTSPVAAIAAKHGSALVTVKFLMVFGENEAEREAGGIVIDPKGLILVSNLEMGGAPRGRESAQAKEIKVLIGDDTQGLPAKLIGRDSELELAWVQLDTPADKPLAALDTSKTTMPAMGDAIVGLDRMNKYYDRALAGFSINVAAIAKKPRTLIIPATSVPWVGLPFFSASGEFAGISVVQQIGGDDEDGGAGRNVGRVAGFDRSFKLLPASEIAGATARAIEAHKAGKELGADETPAKPEGEAKPEGKMDDKPSEKKEEPASMPK